MMNAAVTKRSMQATLFGVVLSFLILFGSTAHAAHPLISDDTGTQGVGGYQIEVNTDWLRDADNKTRTATATLTRGLTETTDIFLDMPFALSHPTGLNDIGLGLKWRLLESDGLSVGLKPELSISSGDQQKQLGDGRSGAALTLLTQYELGDWTWLFNLGTELHRYSSATSQDEYRRYINKASVGLTYQLDDQWLFVMDTGIQSHANKSEKKEPRFAIIGLIYSLSDDAELDVGYKKALNATEIDRQVGIGLTYRFK
jgi:hypothetical protein